MRAFFYALAGLLRYPEADYPQRSEVSLRLAPVECRALLEAFAQAVSQFDLRELEELFTRTFDMNPVCSLEIGWHLFGENYERGLLLVRMREELRRYGLKESSELPDHLTHVLELLGHMERERAADFTAACVLPALEKMVAALSGKGNPFEHVLLAIRATLHARFPEIPLSAGNNEPLLKVLA